MVQLRRSDPAASVCHRVEFAGGRSDAGAKLEEAENPGCWVGVSIVTACLALVAYVLV